jgi:hypothetical protein
MFLTDFNTVWVSLIQKSKVGNAPNSKPFKAST